MFSGDEHYGDDVTSGPTDYAPTASPFPRPVKPAAAPLGRPTPDWQAGKTQHWQKTASENARSPEPKRLDKQFTKALDKASVETERAAAQNDILKARAVKTVHYKGLKQFLADMVRTDTNLDEYKNLVNQYIDGILGKPDYRYSPHKWLDYMRGCIANRCMEAGIKNPTNIDQIRDDVLETAEADGKMGDDTYILDLLKEEIRAFNERIEELDWRADPDAFHKFVTEVKAGDFFVRQILGPDVKEWPPVRLEALRLVREAQAKAAVDGDGHPIAASVKPDWSAAKAAQKAVKDMQQQPAAAAPSAPAKTNNKRYTGFFGTFKGICDANGVSADKTVRDDLRHLAAKNVYGVTSFDDLPEDADLGKIIVEVKNIIAATKSIGDVPAGDSDNLGDWFPRDANGKPIEPNKPAEPPKVEPTVTNTNEPVKSNGGQDNTVYQGDFKPAPNNVINAAPLFAYPESPVVVYPKHDGNVCYKGIRFSVTLRHGGTFAMARPLMDEYAANIDLIDTSCLIRTVPQVVSNAAPRVDAPPMDDEQPAMEAPPKAIESENGTGLARSSEGGKVKYTIWYMAGANETRYPLTVSTPQAVKLLETTLKAKGYAYEKFDNGKRYPIRIKASWTQGAEFAAGKHYRDYVSFEMIEDAVPMAS